MDGDASGSDSDEDGDTDSSADGDSDDDSDGDSDSDDSDSSDSDADSNADSDTNTFMDPCDGLEGAACSENYDADGNPMCAQNVNTDDCYSIVQSQGLYGSGNFDAGYKAAQQSKDNDSLNAIVGVLGAIVGVLLLIVGGGGYLMYRKNRKQMQFRHESIAMDTVEAGHGNADALPMMETA